MVSPFDDMIADAFAALVTTYGETAYFFPRSTGQYASPQADMDRPPAIALVVFTDGTDVRAMFGTGQSQEALQSMRRYAGGDAEIWMSAAQAAELGFEPSKGDLVILPTRDGQPKFAVLSPALKSARGDVRFVLAKETAA